MTYETPAQKIKEVKERLHFIQSRNRLDIVNYKAGCRTAKHLGQRLSELRKEQVAWKKNRKSPSLDVLPDSSSLD
jgi:hypothetical protein